MDTLPETSLFRYLDYTLGCIWYGVLRIWDGILDIYGMVYLGFWWYGPIGPYSPLPLNRQSVGQSLQNCFDDKRFQFFAQMVKTCRGRIWVRPHLWCTWFEYVSIWVHVLMEVFQYYVQMESRCHFLVKEKEGGREEGRRIARDGRKLKWSAAFANTCTPGSKFRP